MSKFSEISKLRLSSCHKDLQTLFNYLIAHYDFTIVCGYRNKEDQNKAYAEKKSTLKYPYSKHNQNPSLAVDAAPYENGIDWSPRQMAYFAGRVKGAADLLYESGLMTHKIRLGIDWGGNNDIDDETFIDAPHFEIILKDT